MATLLELRAAGRLIRFDPALGPDEQELRLIYVLPELLDWLRDKLPQLGSTWQIEQSPEEQLDALIATYCSGEVLQYGRQFKTLNHVRDGIWELKTADLRMFGWFQARDCFIGTAANCADLIKVHRLYYGYCSEAVRKRELLDLDEPKYVPGNDPNAVVSNFDYP
ncbi:MAG: hypothetical protein H6842_08675 [Rhodospirillaceae bacterium]|nr:hypothetical protein [Rhodospirillaceae bacterium]